MLLKNKEMSILQANRGSALLGVGYRHTQKAKLKTSGKLPGRLRASSAHTASCAMAATKAEGIMRLPHALLREDEDRTQATQRRLCATHGHGVAIARVWLVTCHWLARTCHCLRPGGARDFVKGGLDKAKISV
jgi:hypothetical protein